MRSHLIAELDWGIAMNFDTNTNSNRSNWEFEYMASVLAKAALDKKEYRQSRANWWEETQKGVIAEIKESGLEFNESLAVSYASSAGRAPQLAVKPELQNKIKECHEKIREHLSAVREYDGWVQVLSANPESRMKLKHGDWLFFFGTN